MTTSNAAQTTVTRRLHGRVSRGLILVTGVILVPFVLGLVFTSYNMITEQSALRQAFAGVAGQTIAILSALTMVAMTALSRRWRELPLFVGIAGAVCVSAANSISTTGEQFVRLLSDLG